MSGTEVSILLGMVIQAEKDLEKAQQVIERLKAEIEDLQGYTGLPIINEGEMG